MLYVYGTYIQYIHTYICNIYTYIYEVYVRCLRDNLARIKNIINYVCICVFMCECENMYVYMSSLCIYRWEQRIREICVSRVRLLKHAHAQNTLESRSVTIFFILISFHIYI